METAEDAPSIEVNIVSFPPVVGILIAVQHAALGRCYIETHSLDPCKIGLQLLEVNH